MKKLILLMLMPSVFGSLFAQTPSEKEAVLAPVNALFKGMADGDSALVHSAFLDVTTFVSVVVNKENKPELQPERLQDFLKAVGTPHAEAYNEPIWNTKVAIDGHFAQVWANYAFYLGKKFFHCGVDAFHLIQGADGKWKIFHLADTRTKIGCNVPESVRGKFE